MTTNKQTKQKKEKEQKGKKKNQEIGPQFFWLTFYSSFLIQKEKIYKYILSLKKWTDPRIGSTWLAGKHFGWRSERNRFAESFLTPCGYIWDMCLKKKERKQNTWAKHFYCLFLILLKPTMNTTKRQNKNNYKKRKENTTDVHFTKVWEDIKSSYIALQEVCVHAPSLSSLLCTPSICGFIVA